MLTYILALVVALGSLALYMAAFFFPEVHRKNDLIWSGVGMFYALVLWVCAGQIRGGLLLGQTASVVLLGWLGWQTLRLRHQVTAPEQRTPIPGSQELQAKLTGWLRSDRFSKLTQQGGTALTTAKDWVQSRLKPDAAPPSSASPSVQSSQPQPAAASPIALLTRLTTTAVSWVQAQLGSKLPSQPQAKPQTPESKPVYVRKEKRTPPPGTSAPPTSPTTAAAPKTTPVSSVTEPPPAPPPQPESSEPGQPHEPTPEMVEAAIQQAEQQSVEVEAPESEQTAPDTAVPSTAEAESSTPSVLVSAPQHFERYTESAKQVVNLAKEEARTLELDSIGAEHLLLGLVAEGSGIAAQVLKSEGIKIDDARSEVAKLVEQGSSPRPEDIPLAKNARLILDRATDAARNRNQKQVSTAHLLQSVLEVKDDRVLNILKSFEVSPAAIEERLTQMLSDSPDAEES